MALMPQVAAYARAIGMSLDDAANMVKAGITASGLQPTAQNVQQLTDRIVNLNHALGLTPATAYQL